MVKPCACGGTMGRVHLRCLQQWIERRRMDGCDHDALTCEVCRSPYRLRIHESESRNSTPFLSSSPCFPHFSLLFSSSPTFPPSAHAPPPIPIRPPTPFPTLSPTLPFSTPPPTPPFSSPALHLSVFPHFPVPHCSLIRLDLTWERLCSYASISFYAEFCTICATLASMVFLFFLIVIGDSDEEGRELSLFAAVVVAACVITLGILTLFKVTSRWRQAISVPLLSPRGPLSPPIPSSPRLSS
ncbi:unnamed protein product [Closterium sp. Naga37s-1]|nr:unnamed protein product [Closterium sp. Naga37s-1]